MHLTKMHGLGNDYLYYFGEMKNPEAVSIKYSERHFGIGSDGVITISPSKVADFKMRIFNADGSEAMMCGNGVRCVGKYVYDKGYTDKTELAIETLSGIKYLSLKTCGGKVNEVTVNMGEVAVSEPVELDTTYGKVTVTPVSVGNPHAVSFIENAEEAPLTTLGKALEHHSFFPNGVNAEFVQVIERNVLRMRVWERGSGITMACGTGACASAAAAVAAGYCDADKDIIVQLDGGNLKIKVQSDNIVMMTGPAETVSECEVEEV
ncbi:MAG: diaminopimelate epimerase [Lachnospiraceae bacterium]|nr:diaminopimelate epimerase [Lachnospiraceae bacterium]